MGTARRTRNVDFEFSHFFLSTPAPSPSVPGHLPSFVYTIFLHSFLSLKKTMVQLSLRYSLITLWSFLAFRLVSAAEWVVTVGEDETTAYVSGALSNVKCGLKLFLAL